tara:strand:+ start:92 stop:718 length:627 start_codon:yes stop_codon:yes gene_type:complete
MPVVTGEGKKSGQQLAAHHPVFLSASFTDSKGVITLGCGVLDAGSTSPATRSIMAFKHQKIAGLLDFQIICKCWVHQVQLAALLASYCNVQQMSDVNLFLQGEKQKSFRKTTISDNITISCLVVQSCRKPMTDHVKKSGIPDGVVKLYDVNNADSLAYLHSVWDIEHRMQKAPEQTLQEYTASITEANQAIPSDSRWITGYRCFISKV